MENAKIVSLQDGEVEPTGAREVCPGESTGYTLCAENQAEEVSEYFEIEVTEPATDCDLSCLHRYQDENLATCYQVCSVQDPQPGGSCTP